MEENLAFLREWIGYHLHLGVDKFILYDNYGSVGDKHGGTKTANKYGFDLSCFGLTDETMKREFEEIWRDYHNHLIYVPWQPRTETG